LGPASAGPFSSRPPALLFAPTATARLDLPTNPFGLWSPKDRILRDNAIWLRARRRLPRA